VHSSHLVSVTPVGKLDACGIACGCVPFACLQLHLCQLPPFLADPHLFCRQLSVAIPQDRSNLYLTVKRGRGFEIFHKWSGYRQLAIRAQVLSSSGHDVITGAMAGLVAVS